MRKKVDFTGSISSGTLRLVDLIPTCLAIVDEYAPRTAKKLRREYKHVLKRLDEINHNYELKETYDDAGWLWSELFDVLNELAPKGYYFGCHPGDYSNFGFWPIDFN